MSLNRNTKIIRDDYKIFLKPRPCVGCGKQPTDFAHLKARGWGEGKRNDLTGVKLCRACHQYQERNGIIAYNANFNVDLWEENSWCLIEFLLERERQLERIGDLHT